MEDYESQIPILKIDQIVHILGELNIKASANDIKKPQVNVKLQTEKVLQIYKEFLSQLLALNSESVEKEQSDLALHFNEDVIKTQSECFKLLQFYLILQYWFGLCGLGTFFLRMFYPTKAEFLRIASAMIAFCKFEFSELTEFQMVINRTKDYVAKCDLVRREADELQSRVFSTNSEINQLKPLVDKCRSRSEILKEKLLSLQTNRRKLKEERDDLAKEDHGLDVEDKEILAKQQTIAKKFSLYEKLIIRSPEKLIKDTENNEARIVELEKLISELMKEIDEEKRNLFEREKFIENSDKICEILSNLYDTHVQNANLKIRENEAITEETTNLNFELEQTISVGGIYQGERDKIIESRNKLASEIELKLMQTKEKDDKYLSEMKLIQRELDELKEKKAGLTRELNQVNKLIEEKTENGIDTIKFYQNLEVNKKQEAEERLEMIAGLKRDATNKFNLIETRIKQLSEKFSKLI